MTRPDILEEGHKKVNVGFPDFFQDQTTGLQKKKLKKMVSHNTQSSTGLLQGWDFQFPWHFHDKSLTKIYILPDFKKNA